MKRLSLILLMFLPYITAGCEEFNFQMQQAKFLSLVKQKSLEIVSE